MAPSLQGPVRKTTNMEVSLNCCSQIGGNLYRAPFCNGNPNIGPRIIGNLGQSPHGATAENTSRGAKVLLLGREKLTILLQGHVKLGD